jgi:hypothetical protein
MSVTVAPLDSLETGFAYWHEGERERENLDENVKVASQAPSNGTAMP